MKVLPSASRVWNAGRSIFLFSFAQIITQAFALVAGLFVVRIISVEAYAVYALFGALIGAAAVTSDLGISSATTTLLSRTKGADDFEAVVAGVTSLRILLSIVSTAVIVVIFLSNTSVLRNVGMGEIWIMIAAMTCVVILQASANLARAVLASQRKLSVINRVDPISGALRVTILGAAFLLVGESPIVVPVLAWLLSAGLVALWLNRNIPRVRFWPLSPPPTGLIAMLLPLLPGHIYYLVSGLVPVMALGSRAGPEVLAAYWALSRLGMILASMNPLLRYIAHPYVSRGHDDGFLRRSLLVLVAAFAVTLIVVASGYSFSNTWLLLLGPKYDDLMPYVWIALAVVGLQFLVNTFYLMIIASGQTGYQYLSVAAGVLAQVAVIWFTPMRTLYDIYLFVAASLLAQLLVYLALYLRSARILHRRAAVHD